MATSLSRARVVAAGLMAVGAIIQTDHGDALGEQTPSAKYPLMSLRASLHHCISRVACASGMASMMKELERNVSYGLTNSSKKSIQIFPAIFLGLNVDGELCLWDVDVARMCGPCCCIRVACY